MKIFIALLLCFFCTSIVNAQDTNTVQSSSKEKGNVLSKKAEPSTGIEDFFKEFVSHFQVPEINNKSKEFSIRIQFVVEVDGSITEISVLDDKYDITKEVERVMSLLPPWIPAEKDGVKVRSKFTLPVKIHVNDDKPNWSKDYFNDEYLNKFYTYEIDNPWVSFTCDCKLIDAVHNLEGIKGIYEYESTDGIFFYKVEVIDKKAYPETDLIKNLNEFYKKNKAKVGEFSSNQPNIKLYTYSRYFEKKKVYVNTLIKESDLYITTLTIASPSQKGLDLQLKHLQSSLDIKQ